MVVCNRLYSIANYVNIGFYYNNTQNILCVLDNLLNISKFAYGDEDENSKMFEVYSNIRRILCIHIKNKMLKELSFILNKLSNYNIKYIIINI